MDRKFWVVGGEYDAGFETLVDGTQCVAGPFRDALRARTEWQRLTFRDGCGATTRYHIAIEPHA